jgi:hypothetical protein
MNFGMRYRLEVPDDDYDDGDDVSLPYLSPVYQLLTNASLIMIAGSDLDKEPHPVNICTVYKPLLH